MNIGLRPPFTDLLNGANDPYGSPLSLQPPVLELLQNGTSSCRSGTAAGHRKSGPARRIRWGSVAADLWVRQYRAFSVARRGRRGKSPILRNIALTPPYFTWGGYPTLRQAMKLYNRGLNLRQIAPNPALEAPAGTACTTGDNSGTGPDGNQIARSARPADRLRHQHHGHRGGRWVSQIVRTQRLPQPAPRTG